MLGRLNSPDDQPLAAHSSPARRLPASGGQIHYDPVVTRQLFPVGPVLQAEGMAPPEPLRTPSRRGAPPALAAPDAGALPLDAKSEILLRLPGRLLCRLRVVCRAWRSLLSDPWFVAAHAARNREPYIIACYTDDVERESLVDIVDMQGRIVKQVRGKEGDMVVSMASDLVCVKAIESGCFRLLNPVSGAVYHLLNKLADEHAARGFSLLDYGEPQYLFGQVASTGEYKVLRMLPYRRNGNRTDLFEVCTLSNRSLAKWRPKPGPPEPIVWNEWTRVIIGGSVYFLTVDAYFGVMNHRVIEQDCIVHFDLEAEEWGLNIRGPNNLVPDALLNRHHNYSSKQVTLANLNGSLVIVLGSTHYMDLWFLTDSEKGLWVKYCSVQVERSGHLLPMYPLVMLDDGRIVTLIRSIGLLQIFDPRRSAFSSLMMLKDSSRIGVFTGSLLSLGGENK